MRRVVMVLILAMTACSGGKTVESAPTSSSVASTVPIATSRAPIPTIAATTTTIAPTTTTVPVFTIGAKVSYTDGSSVQAFAYATNVVSSNRFEQPSAGNLYSAADVQICAGQAVEHANPASFELAMADNTRVRETIAVKEPALHLTDVAPGDCVRGFVTFEAPAATPVGFLVYTGSRIPTKWKI